MKIIPVIDLLAGRAVWARRGKRREYRPVDSPLCAQGEVLPLVDRLVSLYGAKTLYLADLDAIEGRGGNVALLTEIHQRHTDIELWVDAGFTGTASLNRFLERRIARPVVGSESWQSSSSLNGTDALLSIDRDNGGLRDPSKLANDPARWPDELILMNLNRVGSGEGPDLAWLAEWRLLAPAKRLHVAGGIRYARDIRQLADAGAAGVLLASALHQGDLTAADLAHHR